MIQALYTTKMSMLAQQKRTEVIANNVANINTIGFKSSSVSFKDTLYSNMQRPVGEQDDYNLMQGTGVKVSAISNSFQKGIPITTGAPLDAMIDGEGFFTIQDTDGGIGYTRNGAFNLSIEDGGNYLVTASGDYVLDENGQKITIPSASGDLAIDPAGTISFNNVAIATLGIVTFVNKNGLEEVGTSKFKETVASGNPIDVVNPNVKQGYLENSNVDLSLELTRLIRAQRTSSLSARAMTTVDSMLGIGNNLRG